MRFSFSPGVLCLYLLLSAADQQCCMPFGICTMQLGRQLTKLRHQVELLGSCAGSSVPNELRVSLQEVCTFSLGMGKCRRKVQEGARAINQEIIGKILTSRGGAVPGSSTHPEYMDLGMEEVLDNAFLALEGLCGENTRLWLQQNVSCSEAPPPNCVLGENVLVVMALMVHHIIRSQDLHVFTIGGKNVNTFLKVSHCMGEILLSLYNGEKGKILRLLRKQQGYIRKLFDNIIHTTDNDNRGGALLLLKELCNLCWVTEGYLRCGGGDLEKI